MATKTAPPLPESPNRARHPARLRTWLIAGAAVVALGAGATWVAMRSPGDEGQPLGPSASPGASPGLPANPSTSPSDLALPGQVTVDPSLPSALPLPPGIWGQTGPGWVLATYQPQIQTWGDDGISTTTETTRQVIYLVSPEGTRYQVLELDPNNPIRIDSWSAGETRAFVACGDFDSEVCSWGSGSTATLDLTTGVSTPYGEDAGADHIELTLPGSVRLWIGASDGSFPSTAAAFLEHGGVFEPLGQGWEAPSLSPDGAWVSLDRWDANPDGTNTSRTGVVATATSAVMTLPDIDPALGCSSYGWSEDDQVIEWCAQEGVDTNRWFTVDPATGVATEFVPVALGPNDAGVNHSVWVAPGVWAGSYGLGDPWMRDDASPSVGIDDHGILKVLDLLDANGESLVASAVRTAVDGIVYAYGQRTSFEEGVSPITVIAYDSETGRQTILLPEPPAGPTVGAPPSFDVQAIGVTSWMVAP